MKLHGKTCFGDFGVLRNVIVRIIGLVFVQNISLSYLVSVHLKNLYQSVIEQMLLNVFSQFYYFNVL